MESEGVLVATFVYRSTSFVMGDGTAREAQTKTL